MPPALTTSSHSIGAVVRLDARDPPTTDAVDDRDAGDGRAWTSPPHPRLPGPCRQRHRQVGRIELAVGGQERRAEHAGGVEQAVEEIVGLLGRHELERAAGRRPSGLPLQLLTPSEGSTPTAASRPLANRGRGPVAARRRYRSVP